MSDYLAAGESLGPLQLLQNYAYMMLMETTAFQERYGFELGRWREEFSGLCLKRLGDSRRFAAR